MLIKVYIQYVVQVKWAGGLMEVRAVGNWIQFKAFYSFLFHGFRVRAIIVYTTPPPTLSSCSPEI